MRKVILVLAVLAIFTSMAQGQRDVKFLLTSYQRVDLREDSNRYPETDFVEDRALLIVGENEATISGICSFDLILVGDFKETEMDPPEGCTEATKYEVDVLDVADGEEGILNITHFVRKTDGVIWGVYLVWRDTEMYYQFIGESLTK